MDATQLEILFTQQKRIAFAEHALLEVAQSLSPGWWVLQIFASMESEPDGDGRWKTHKCFRACVSNGDDNVTGTGKTIAEAVAHLVYLLLRGSVYPLGGNGGVYLTEADRRDSEQAKQARLDGAKDD